MEKEKKKKREREGKAKKPESPWYIVPHSRCSAFGRLVGYRCCHKRAAGYYSLSRTARASSYGVVLLGVISREWSLRRGEYNERGVDGKLQKFVLGW